MVTHLNLSLEIQSDVHLSSSTPGHIVLSSSFEVLQYYMETEQRKAWRKVTVIPSYKTDWGFWTIEPSLTSQDKGLHQVGLLDLFNLIFHYFSIWTYHSCHLIHIHIHIHTHIHTYTHTPFYFHSFCLHSSPPGITFPCYSKFFSLKAWFKIHKFHEVFWNYARPKENFPVWISNPFPFVSYNLVFIILFIIYLFRLFEAGSHYVAQGYFELMILLPQPPECWGLQACTTTPSNYSLIVLSISMQQPQISWQLFKGKYCPLSKHECHYAPDNGNVSSLISLVSVLLAIGRQGM
jgi:hypothetical protein